MASAELQNLRSARWFPEPESSLHETGHRSFCEKPTAMIAGEGPAIRSGMADFCAAVATGSAEPYVGLDCARSVSNDFRVRGSVYGGFTWRVTEEVARHVGDINRARQLMVGVVATTVSLLPVVAPTAEDFVDAFGRATRHVLSRNLAPSAVESVVAAARLEGLRRGLIR